MQINSISKEIMIAGKTLSLSFNANVIPQIIRRPEIGFYYSNPRRMYQGVPDIEITQKGKLWAAWMGGGYDEDLYNYIILASSNDSGKSWICPHTIIDPDKGGPVRAFDPCLWHDPDGRLWLFWTQGILWPGEYSGGVWYMNCANPECDSPEWSIPKQICGGVMKNKPVVLSNGKWLLPVAFWKDDLSARVYCSDDSGKTFYELGGAEISDPANRDVEEHRIIEKNDQSLWMLVRTNYGIGESFSFDQGKTWTKVTPCPNIKHTNSRFYLGRLKSGRLLFIKHGYIYEDKGRLDMKAFLSDDDGKTWNGALDITAGHPFYQEGHKTQDGVDRYFSYPDAAEGNNGNIYCIYDYSRTCHEAIFISIFTEDDILNKGKKSTTRTINIAGNNINKIGDTTSKK